MTLEEFSGRSGIEHVRIMRNLFSHCTESFNQRFGLSELFALYKAYSLCDWDIPPSRWEERQVKEALRGIVPRWDNEELPLYS